MIFALVLALSLQPTWTPVMDSFARATEAEFHFPHGTCRAFARQESGYDTTATRIESPYFNEGSRYATAITSESMEYLANAKDAAIHNRDTALLEDIEAVPLSVERSQRSISYGLFQCMGETLRVCGYDRMLIAPTMAEQFHYFGAFTSGLFKRYHTLARVASAYNTGSPNKTSIRYVKNILKYQKQYAY